MRLRSPSATPSILDWRRVFLSRPRKQYVYERLSIEQLKAVTIEQQDRAERRVVRGFTRYFRDFARRMAAGVRDSDVRLHADAARAAAGQLIHEIYDHEQEMEILFDVAVHELLPIFVIGARSEEVLSQKKSTSAQEIAERLEYDVPAGVSLGPYPEWMIEAATDTLNDTFDQDYWQRIPQNTRDDVHRMLIDGIEHGDSITKLAKKIMQEYGSRPYTETRARAVARTETTSMLNAGHAAGISNLAEETGLPLGKEWLSVRGNTTRPSHAELHGTVVAHDGNFSLGGVMIPYPGHFSLPGEERINCQCTVLSNIGDMVEAGIFDEMIFEEDEALVPAPISVTPPPPAPDAPEVAPVERQSENGIPHLDDLEKTDRQIGGSTGAEVWQDKDGNLYVVKRGTSPQHLIEEYIAEEMYRDLGVPVPPSRLITDLGAPVKISKFIDDAKTIGSLSGKAKKDAIKQAQKHFAMDAFMANWDAAGLGMDNMLVDKDGKVWRIDMGGALRFRAQGQKKDAMVGKQITELWSLRDSDVNSDTAEMFGGMTWSEIRKSNQLVLVDSKGKSRLTGFARIIDDVRARAAVGGVDVGHDLDDFVMQRFKSAEQIEETSKVLAKDKWTDAYADSFNKHEQFMERHRMFVDFPKRFTVDGIGGLIDERGDKFDHLRGKDSVTGKFETYLRSQGTDWKFVKKYADSQTASSWSGQSVIFKAHLVNSRGAPMDGYWFESSRIGRQIQKASDLPKELDRLMNGKYEQYKEAMIAQHALTYNLMKRVDMPNSDRNKGTVSLVRTEDKSVLESYGLKEPGDYGKVKRGAAESFGLTHDVVVGGNVQTYQEVPHIRVLFHYAQARKHGRSKYDGMFMDDEENELICMTEGLDVLRWQRTSGGKPTLTREEWESHINTRRRAKPEEPDPTPQSMTPPNPAANDPLLDLLMNESTPDDTNAPTLIVDYVYEFAKNKGQAGSPAVKLTKATKKLVAEHPNPKLVHTPAFKDLFIEWMTTPNDANLSGASLKEQVAYAMKQATQGLEDKAMDALEDIGDILDDEDELSEFTTLLAQGMDPDDAFGAVVFGAAEIADDVTWEHLPMVLGADGHKALEYISAALMPQQADKAKSNILQIIELVENGMNPKDAVDKAIGLPSVQF